MVLYSFWNVQVLMVKAVPVVGAATVPKAVGLIQGLALAAYNRSEPKARERSTPVMLLR
jgi:hypothetical protein